MRADNRPSSPSRLRLGRRARILDAGCGSGRDLDALRRMGLDAVGVDAAAGMLRHARRHGPVLCADLRALPCPDDSVDGVLAAASLLHLTVGGDAEAAMAELRRVLIPGGRLTLSVLAGVGVGVEMHPDGRLFQLHDDVSVDMLLRRAGFDVVHRQTDVDPRRDGVCWLLRVAEA